MVSGHEAGNPVAVVDARPTVVCPTNRIPGKDAADDLELAQLALKLIRHAGLRSSSLPRMNGLVSLASDMSAVEVSLPMFTPFIHIVYVPLDRVTTTWFQWLRMKALLRRDSCGASQPKSHWPSDGIA